MFTIYIDGKKYHVNKSSNVLEACLSHGFNLPYFCWHPALGSVGSCRQCAVKQYQNISDHDGRIVMSCMTPVVNDLVISVYDDEARNFRKDILELLMVNHPHDCPVCSEGGHCHLQDMTVMTGHCVRRYRFLKRTHLNQNLGPFILHEMNRCISCYRCVRFYKDYADGNDLGVYGVHDNLYFGRFQEGQLESEFSGNLIEICPTGVFTDKTYAQYYARKWDIYFSPSICVHCSVGCNVILGERYGKLCRVENRYHRDVNGYFLCDRGRFGYGYVNNVNNRYSRPLEKKKNGWVELNKAQAIQRAVNILQSSKKVIGIGSTRASVESNCVLKNLVGSENFYFGINRFEYQLLLHILNILQHSGVHVASIKDIENSDAILLLGEDVTQTSSRISLAIRQAVKARASVCNEKKIPIWNMNAIISSLDELKRNPLFITSVEKTKLDDIASWTYYASLRDQARFGFSVAHAIDNTAPLVNNISSDLSIKVNMVAQALLTARKPLIISGSNVGNISIISSLANIAKSLKNCGKDVSISLIASDVNSVGLSLLDGVGNLEDLLDLIKKKVKIDSLIILETDLDRHLSSDYVDAILRGVKDLIVLDHQKLSFHDQASLIFSSTVAPESDGTFVSQEGRAQRFFRVYDPHCYDSSLVVLESWSWLSELCSVFFKQPKLSNLTFDTLINNIAVSYPKLSKICLAAPDASFRLRGQKLSRAPHRCSGRSSVHASINVHEPRVLQDHNSMFTFSMEGNNSPDPIRQHIAFVWAPGWNSSQAWNKFHSELREDLCSGDSGVHFFDRNNCDQIMDCFFDFREDELLSSDVLIEDSVSIWNVVPYWHIFGSEEMSQRSLSVQSCIPKAYVVLNRIDAVRCNLYDKKILKFTCGSQRLSLPLVFSDKLASGCIGLPIGLPGIPFSYLGMCIRDVQGVF